MSDNWVIFGRDWFREPRGWRDVLRCLFGRHRPVMVGVGGHEIVYRCSCGAIRLKHGVWMESRPFHRR